MEKNGRNKLMRSRRGGTKSRLGRVATFANPNALSSRTIAARAAVIGRNEYAQVAEIIVENKNTAIPIGFIENRTMLPHSIVSTVLGYFEDKNFITVDKSKSTVMENPQWIGKIF